MIDFRSSVAYNFWQMSEGAEYRMCQSDWDSYQAARASLGCSQGLDRARARFRREGSRLYFQNAMVWDFAKDPNPSTLIFTLSLLFPPFPPDST